jgi:hypothetical protein
LAPPLELPKTFQNKFLKKNLIDPSIITTTNSELDVVIIDLAQVKVDLPNNHKRKKMYELNCHFQNSWAIKLPWAKSIMGVDGKVT